MLPRDAEGRRGTPRDAEGRRGAPRGSEGQRAVIYLLRDPGDAGGGIYLDQPPCLECGHWMQRELVPGGEMLTCIGPTGCGARFWLDRWPYEPLERVQRGSPE